MSNSHSGLRKADDDALVNVRERHARERRKCLLNVIMQGQIIMQGHLICVVCKEARF